METIRDLFSVRIDKDALVAKVKASDTLYFECIDIALHDESPWNWRSMWITQHCTAKNDTRFQKYISDFISALLVKNDSFQRECLKNLDKMVLDDEQEGRFFDACMQLWENIAKSSAVRFMAFKMIHKIVKKYPELKGELEFLSQEHYLAGLSPGIQTIARRMVASMNNDISTKFDNLK